MTATRKRVYSVKQDHDVEADQHQSIASIVAMNQRSRDWVNSNVDYEDWQVTGGAICVDHRYLDDLVSQMREAGLSVFDRRADRRRIYCKRSVARRIRVYCLARNLFCEVHPSDRPNFERYVVVERPAATLIVGEFAGATMRTAAHDR